VSSPIAKTSYSAASGKLIRAHEKLSHKHRVSLLSQALAAKIGALAEHRVCMDIGCGDMSIAESIEAELPSSTWRCIDLYTLPAHLCEEEKWKKYVQFDGRRLPFADQSVDVALVCDALHHMGPGVPVEMLRETGRVARRVVVKDHFEYGFWSRQSLRAMDFLGNWAYGVSVPKRYFDQDSFNAAVAAAGLRVESMHVGVDLYNHLPIVRSVLQKQWQFIAVLAA
jgi:hypothetical protein